MKGCIRTINGELRYCLLFDVNGISPRDQEEMINSFSKSQKRGVGLYVNKRESPHTVLSRHQNSRN